VEKTHGRTDPNLRHLTETLWAEMLENGSEDTQASAQGIIEEILAKNAVDALRIQLELVQEGRSIDETEAGRAARSKFWLSPGDHPSA